jgi:hypothetical protein
MRMCLQVALVLPSIEKAFGMGWLYTGFAIVAAVAWGVIYCIVVETKGKTLEEIEALLLYKEVTPEGKPAGILSRTRTFNNMDSFARTRTFASMRRASSMRRAASPRHTRHTV